MGNGIDIYIDQEKNVLFISLGAKVTEESIKKIKDSLNNHTSPYSAVYAFENISSVQYVSNNKYDDLLGERHNDDCN